MWLLAMTIARAGLTVIGPPADRLLIERIAAGDGPALAALYDQHARAVYSLALRILRNPSDAEDVVQEVFAQVWRQSARYEAAKATVTGWLLMQTRSRAIDKLRGRKVRPEGADTSAVLDRTADLAPSPESEVERTERATRVRAALDSLPLLQRMAVELAYYEGLTHAEIASHLEQPLGTVKTRIRQALMTLRAALGDEGLVNDHGH